jgi:hypothetical protein
MAYFCVLIFTHILLVRVCSMYPQVLVHTPMRLTLRRSRMYCAHESIPKNFTEVTATQRSPVVLGMYGQFWQG